MSRSILLDRRRCEEGSSNDDVCWKTRGRAVMTDVKIASNARGQENMSGELAGSIRNKLYSILSDNSRIKSVEFARRCNKLGIKASVVLCLAMFRLQVPFLNSKMPIIGPHFYVEALGKQYEVSYFSQTKKQNVPRVLTCLGRFKITGSKSSCGK